MIGLFAEPVPGDSWQSYTALGILAVVVIFLVTKLIPSMNTNSVEQTRIFAEAIRLMHVENSVILDKMLVRSEARELEHHTDFVALSETLRGLVAQCSRRGVERQHELEDRLKKEDAR